MVRDRSQIHSVNTGFVAGLIEMKDINEIAPKRVLTREANLYALTVVEVSFAIAVYI